MNWKETLMVFLVLGLIPAAILAWGGGVPDGYRLVSKLLVAFCLASLAGLGCWNWKSLSKPDIFPDVLAKLVNPRQIFEVGDAHFNLGNLKHAGRRRVVCVAQNLVDSPNRFSLVLTAKGSGTRFMKHPIPNLEIVLPPAGVVQAMIDLPLNEVTAAADLAIRMSVSTASEPGGRRIRFQRRNALTKSVNPALTVSLLAVGVLVAGGGVLMELELDSTDGPGVDDAQWNVALVWKPEGPSSALRA